MSTLKEMKTIVRTDTVARLVEALEKEGVTRFWISHIHSIGTGVDPEDFRLSFDDGGSYTEKAKIEFLVRADRADMIVDLIRTHCGTGHRGDGVVVVTDVDTVINVRTGARDRLGLL